MKRFKQCRACGKYFEPKKQTPQKDCSPECHMKIRREQGRKYQQQYRRERGLQKGQSFTNYNNLSIVKDAEGNVRIKAAVELQNSQKMMRRIR